MDPGSPPEGSEPSVTRGFLFADLRGYTDFVEHHGDDAAAALLTRYRALVRGVVARFNGAEIRTEGDGFYVVFPSASSAVQGGLAVLAAAQGENERDPERPIRVAVGVHAGETAETHEGPVGSAVNIAARVCSQARAGELLVTDTVRSLTRTRLPVRFLPRGAPRLKGIAEPIALFAVAASSDDTAAGARFVRARGLFDGPRRALVGIGVAGLAAVVVAFIVFGHPGPNPVFAPPGGSASNASTGASPGSLPTRDQGSQATPSSTSPAVPPSASTAPLACSTGADGKVPPIADVPFYRADASRDSVYPGPGPVCQPIVAWQQQLGPAANFVPIVVDGLVIVGDQKGLHAFDARTGSPAWSVAGSGGFIESAGADNGVIFAADLGGKMHAIDARSGAERWTAALPNNGIHPLVAQGLLWVGSSDGHAYGLDLATGNTRWTWTGPPGAQVDVNVVTSATAYLGSAGTQYAIRLVDQSELWHFDTHGTGRTGPVMAGDTLYVGAQGGGQNALYALDSATGKNRWAPPFGIASGGQITPGPALQGVLYAATDGDGVYALRDKGASYDVLWHDPEVGSAYRPASLVAASRTVYVQPNEAPLVALRMSDGSKLWEATSDAPAEEAPIVSGGLVFQVDDESNVLRAWAEPSLVALLGAPASRPSPSAAPSAPDPFTVTATYPWFQTGIAIPAAIAIGPDGLLYVLHAKGDYSDPRVTLIDPKTGHPVMSWGQYGSGPGQLDLTATDGNGPGGCIQVAPNGLVYVGERGNQRVEVFKRDGTFVRQIGAGQLGSILFCKLGPDGSLYTGNDDGDPFANEMAKFDPGGRLAWRMLADPQHPRVEFQVHGFAIRRDGKILGFIDSGGAVIIDPSSGRIVGHWTTDGLFGGSGEPSIDAAGNVYLYTYVPGEFQVFDPKGHLIGGLYDSGPQSDYQFASNAFWPPPVFDKRGFGYSFGSDGLVQFKLAVP